MLASHDHSSNVAHSTKGISKIIKLPSSSLFILPCVPFESLVRETTFCGKKTIALTGNIITSDNVQSITTSTTEDITVDSKTVLSDWALMLSPLVEYGSSEKI